MRGGFLGGLCFLAFLVSSGDAETSEDLATGVNLEDSMELSEAKAEEHDDSDERSFSLLPGLNHGLDFSNYANLLGPSNQPNAFSYYNPGYNSGPNYGEGMASAQATSSGFGSSYASSEAAANAQAFADLNSYNSPFTGYFGSGQIPPQSTGFQLNQNPVTWGSFDPNSLPYSSSSHAQVQSSPALLPNLGSSFASAEADDWAQAFASGFNFGGHSSEVGPYSQFPSFSPGLSTLHASAESGINSHSNPFGLPETGPFGSAYFSTGFPSVDSQSAFGSGLNSLSLGSDAFAHSLAEGHGLYGSNLDSSHTHVQSQTSSAVATAFVGIQSRTIPHDEYIIPRIPDGESGLSCSKSGELHNVWSAEYECLICACVSQYGYLSPVCIRCDLCIVPVVVTPIVPPPPPPVPPVPIYPEIVPLPEVSCDPLPTNTPFQNPLNPCQICICQHSFGLEQDVSITCEETPSCVTPDSMIVPPNVDVILPPILTCEKFPPNVIFPHPFDICQNCECIESHTGPIPEEKIVCFPTPGCESMHRPSPKPEVLPDATTLLPLDPPPQFIPLPSPSSTPEPGPLPWPPSPHLPLGPLPGPPPHKSCAPYPPNQQFQHPWDDCQICVCSEIYSIGVVNIEVNCFTNPTCCIEYGVLQPTQPIQIGEPIVIPDTINVPGLVPVPRPYAVPDVMDYVCESKRIGEEFLHGQCKICNCQMYGSYAVPVCRRVNKAECVILPAAVSVGSIVYIEPKCRYRVPVEPFTSGCSSCLCQSVFSYVVAKCHPIPGCGQSQHAVGTQTGSLLNNQIGLGNPQLSDLNAAAVFGSTLPGFGTSFLSGSAFADASAQSGFGGYQSSDLNAALFGQSSGLGYPHLSPGASFLENPATSGSTLYNSPFGSYGYSGNQASDMQSLHQSLYAKPYATSPSYNPGLLHNVATFDSGMGALGHNYASGFGGRLLTKSGDAEDYEERKR